MHTMKAKRKAEKCLLPTQQAANLRPQKEMLHTLSTYTESHSYSSETCKPHFPKVCLFTQGFLSRGTLGLHLDYTQITLRLHSDCIRITLRLNSDYTWIPFKLHICWSFYI